MQKINSLPIKSEKTVKRDYWRDHVERWGKSTLSQEAYCKAESISYNSFVYWRGVFLSESQIKPIQSTFTRVKVAATQSTTSDASRIIQIKLLSGHHIYLPDTMKIENITAIIQALSVQHA